MIMKSLEWEKLQDRMKKATIPSKLKTVILDFYGSYSKAISQFPNSEKHQERFNKLIDLILENVLYPRSFEIFHRSVRHPFDYYQFGLDFMRPFVDFSCSQIFGLENIQKIRNQLSNGENVILFANHQIEPDPQIISLLLEKIDPKLAADMVFVAGHRVISDPMAIPMSLGRNLLCIYSKKHMNTPPEEKASKVQQNQRTLKQMQELLNQGGYCIYVAPSGGRDRQNKEGKLDVSPFDPQSIELFWLMGNQSASPTHFYPLSLQTYSLMPPPNHVEKELGEKRVIQYTPVFLAFGDEIDMVNFPGSENGDKRTKRVKRADYIWNLVRNKYQAFPKG